MNLVLTMALGSRTWGDFALNLCLSVRATHPKAKLGLIHDGLSIAGLEREVEQFFDYSYRVQDSDPAPQPLTGGVGSEPYFFITAYERAFYTKTQLFDIAKSVMPEFEGCIYLDADVLMLPGRSVDEWFNVHKGRAFTCWNNALYNTENNTTLGSGYTFWCEPETIKPYWDKLHKPITHVPQINSSFLYFENDVTAMCLFDRATQVWADKEFKYKPYKGVKPDELCFNIACAATGIMPHQFPYYPIFFQFASEHFEETYIMHGWPALGFAGDGLQSEHLCGIYNKYVAYYREVFGVDEEFKFDNSKKSVTDSNPIRIEPVRKRTLYRRGEVKGSFGGIFNPSGLVLNERISELANEQPKTSFITIYRKESNHHVRQGYLNESAVPYIQVLEKDREFERELIDRGFNVGERLEDFRLFEWCGRLYCSHTLITQNLRNDMRAGIAISEIDNKFEVLQKVMDVKLPIETRPVEKNWVFFEPEKGRLHCIYSISPYRLFMLATHNLWVEVPKKQPELKWFHYGQPICNSTNPILIGEHYFVMFHTKEAGVYHHGAVLIDRVSLEITHYTRNSIFIKEPHLTEGIGKGIVYVSGACLIAAAPSAPEGGTKDHIRIFFGEADSSSCYVDYNAMELIDAIKKFPATPSPATAGEQRRILEVNTNYE